MRASEAPSAPSPLVRRRIGARALIVTIAVLAIGCAAWSAAWLYAARAARHGLDGWIEQEAGHGRLWTCTNLRTVGFPFRLALLCEEPRFEGVVGGKDRSASAAAARVTSAIWSPTLLRISVAGPVRVRGAGQDHALRLDWRRLRAEVSQPSASRRRVAASIDGLSVRIGASGRQPMVWSMAHLSLAMRPSSKRAGAERLMLRAQRARIPQLASLLGVSSPVTGSLNAILTHAGQLAANLSETGIEQWRRAGGSLDVANARARQGKAHISASGTLGLDGAHRLRGTLQAQGSHLGQTLARLGAPPNVIMMNSLVGGLFGAPSSAGRGGLSLPLTFAGGRLSIGPFITSVRLAPLY